MNDKPIRLFNFLMALSALSRTHGVIIVNGDMEFKEDPKGMYCLNPNEGPEFGWRDQSGNDGGSGARS